MAKKQYTDSSFDQLIRQVVRQEIAGLFSGIYQTNVAQPTSLSTKPLSTRRPYGFSSRGKRKARIGVNKGAVTNPKTDKRLKANRDLA